ncbi:MAG TPA: MBL fold metallo-hydrolase [Myxococcota bacterium]|nr:MBL fold metallo-hydrolase [Myxococcota bacterium]HOC99247.1 MBL fold metallo-hydrolase [Myxococcota bacterium]HOH76959.1 MBL fold metallo-hydrolase [Myxococcota bacterium]
MSLTFKRYLSLLVDKPPARPGDGINVTWLGNAGVHVTDGITGFLIDPFVSRYGMLRVALGLGMPPMQDVIAKWAATFDPALVGAVIASHSHYDHALDAPFFARLFDAPLVGTESTANIGRGARLSDDFIKVVGHADTMEIGAFKITFLESVHGPALFNRVPYPGVITSPLVSPAGARGYRMGGVFGIVIQHPAGTLVHHGSAGYDRDMYAGHHADVVLLGIAGRAGTSTYLKNVVDALGARTVIPIHFDNMFHPVSTSFRFMPAVHFDEFLDVCLQTRPNMNVSTLPVGRPVGLLINGSLNPP